MILIQNPKMFDVKSNNVYCDRINLETVIFDLKGEKALCVKDQYVSKVDRKDLDTIE
jgi:hypothetical protein